MNPIPQNLIDAMPESVEATTESCQAAADATLLVLFLIGGQVEGQEWPPIISNGAEVWKLPAPWTSSEGRMAELLNNLNGGDDDIGLLAHLKNTAIVFNEAIEDSALPEAERIAKQMPADSAAVWSDLNALACRVEDENVYKPITLNAEVHGAYSVAVGGRS